MSRFALELRRASRDRALAVLLVLFALACGYAAHVGTHWTAVRSESLRLVRAEAEDAYAPRRAELVAAMRDGNKASGAAIYATATPFRATLPVAPGAALSIGRAEVFPAAATITPFADPEGIFSAYTAGLENPAVLDAGRFDLGFVIVVLMPLLLLAGCYDMWTDERERGTDRLLLSQPVRAGTLLVERVGTRALLLLVPMMVVVVGATGWAAPAAGPAWLAVLALAVLLYGGLWLAVAAVANTYVRRSTSAALVAITAWLVVTALLPALLTAMLDGARPRPSEVAHLIQLRAETVTARSQTRDWMLAHPHATDPSWNYNKLLWTQRREAERRDQRIAPIADSYHAADDARAALAAKLRLLSPSAIMQDALDRLAGTDAGRAHAFAVQARAFVGTARAYSDGYMMRDRLLRPEDYERRIPRFVFREPDVGGPIVADLAALAAMLAALVAAVSMGVRQGRLDRLGEDRDA